MAVKGIRIPLCVYCYNLNELLIKKNEIMKRWLYGFLAVVLLFAACNNEEENKLLSHSDKKGEVANHFYGVKRSEGIRTRGIVQTTNLWYQNATIRIKFINGRPEQHDLVKQYANEWQQHIGLTFKYVDSGDAEVRISFDWYDEGRYVTWSYTGTDCKYNKNQNEPTANFVEFDVDDIDDERVLEKLRGDVLRVFGQILGLELEHRHLNFDPEWVKGGANAKAYWEREIEDIPWDELKKYVFDPLNEVPILQTPEFDPQSIMIWPFRKSIANSGDLRDPNYELSQNDIAFIKMLYPSTLGPDNVWPGKKNSVYVELPGHDYWWGLRGTRGYDYINNVELAYGDKIKAKYPTVEVGEYEWMAANLLIRYGNPEGYFEDMNLPEDYYLNYAGDACPNMRAYEHVFGTWATDLPYLDVVYRDRRYFHVWRDDSKNEELPGFDLPVEADIYQIIGHMPHTTGNAVTDFLDFAMGIREDVPGVDFKAIRAQWPRLNNASNLSGLTIPPTGLNNAGTYHWSFGYGFSLRLRDCPKVFVYTDPTQLIFTNLYHWGSARYCRPLSDEELSYRLYIDKEKDCVAVLGINDSDNVDNLPELPKGLERGVALHYMNKNLRTITKPWSEIRAEAAEINAQVGNDF